VGNRYTSIGSRDGEGRPLSITNLVNAVSALTETLTWSGDGLLATHTLARADFTDPHVYTYANLSRRLVQEQLNLNGSTAWTNTMVYDKGVSGGPGVLTQMGQANSASNEWNSVSDAFSRVTSETNSTFQYPAYGHVNGQSILLSAWLDNQPVSIAAVGTNAMQWRAMMDLAPGAHQLKVSALHPSGVFTAWTTNLFTNSLAYQATADSFDGAGNITNRVWKNPSGTVERTQTLSWDARGRLHQVIERDANNSGYNWSAVYDPLNRRLQTSSVLVSNGVASTAPQTINSYFDPQFEFLELGVSYGLQTVFKLYGPDLNGRYGGLNGTGGFDGFSPYLNLFYPVITDFRGNVLGEITNGVVSWNPARPTGYGAVPGYRPLALGNGADISLSSAWRGHWADITGYHQIGLRPYDPVSGRWMTYDSVWNARDLNYYTFAGGELILGFDPDGRCVEQEIKTDWNALPQFALNVGNNVEQGNNDFWYGAFTAGGQAVNAAEHPINTTESVINGGATLAANLSVDPSGTAQNIYNGLANNFSDPSRASQFIGGLTFGAETTIAGGAAYNAVNSAVTYDSVSSLFAGTAQTTSAALNPVQILQNLTDQSAAALNANPSLANTVLSPAENLAAQTRPFLNPVAYGNAIQRLVNDQIANSESYSSIFQIVGGPNNPDYIGAGSASGMNFDITTPGQVGAHLARPGYGQGLNVITYQRAPGWTLPAQ
jgi:RHS repeat-associated protein